MKQFLHFSLTVLAVISLAFSVNAQILSVNALTYYSTDFSGNGTNFPADWTGDIVYDNYDWIISTDGLPGDGHPGNVGENMPAVCFYDYTNDGSAKEMISPAIGLTSATSPELTFIYYNRYGRNSEAPIVVSVTTDDGANYTEVWSNTSAYNTSWVTMTVDLNAYVGSTIKVKFSTLHSGSTSYPYIDNFRVGEPDNTTACDAPTSLNAGGITDAQATLTWSGSAGDYKYAYGEDPYSPGTSAGTLWSNTSKTITGLNPGTTYNFYVKSVCSAGSESTWAAVQFTTTGSGTYVKNIDENTNLSIYPNPTNGQFTINATFDSYKNITVEMFDLTGKVILTRIMNNVNGINENISLENVSKGIYYVKIEGNDFVKQTKVIVE